MTEKPSNKQRSASGSYQTKGQKQRTERGAPRRRLVLNPLDALRVQRLAEQLGVSEEETLHLAIQSFAPTTTRSGRRGLRARAERVTVPESGIDTDAIARDAEGIATTVKMEWALDNALKAVNEANESVLKMRRDLNDPERRAVMEAEIRQQLSGDESFLDEVAAMMRNRDMEGGAQ